MRLAREAPSETTTDAGGRPAPPSAAARDDPSLSAWHSLREDHRRAADAFAAAALAVPEADWQRPRREGHWSPGQIGEHLVLSYEVVLRELAGGQGMRVRTGFWRRLLIRFRYLPLILRDGQLPHGARAVREIRPTAEPRAAGVVSADFLALATRFDAELTRARASNHARTTHPIFGTLDASQTLRFVTVHVDHHRRQLPRQGTPDTHATEPR